MKTVAILEGWAGGNWHTKKFRAALTDKGFELTNKVATADIIVAHSTGCYRVPNQNKAYLLLMMGPPHWPNKSIIRRLVAKKKHDNQLVSANEGRIYVLKKSFWEWFYIFAKPSYTFIALGNHKSLDFLDKLSDKKIVLVRNDEDVYCSPDLGQLVSKYPNIKYLELPGGHDDYYTNPRPYIDLLVKEL